ncbi:amiloride-sensitive sodium channel subunit beta-like [Mercenaria mercenaria]|uniref:amiloride-sensitive sodium channel subunit beta-like n=1 Tax=Mercenaria mercenaria TaxID=6596 RepID=UPI00234F60BB|nr:amiloride-sensitive sodium channel subunit beta-like [Mercenaria mercenaria]
MSRNKIGFETMTEEKDLNGAEGHETLYNKHLKSVLKRFTERTSMHGCGYIQTSRHLVSRLLWGFLTLLAICVLIVHLYQITDQYTNWHKKTKVSLEFNNLRFPAVTICNVNLIKNSAVSKYANKELQGLIKAVNPDSLLANIATDNFKRNNDSASNGTEIKKRRRRSVSELYNIEWTQFDKDFDSEPITANTVSEGDDERMTDQAPLSIMWDIFRFQYMKLSKTERAASGHDINDMLLECMFNGRTCNARNFTLHQTSSYGNCYTLDSERMYVQRPGPDGGLYLLLYLQVNEFIKGITNGFGAKLVIHEPGTAPLPDDGGVFVAANTETDIALKRTAITRLGWPYGKCETGAAFKEKFGVNYSVKACPVLVCHETCKAIHIYETCGCWHYMHELVSEKLNKPFNICKTTSDRKCQRRAMQSIYSKEIKCECNNPCRDAQYTVSVSGRQWPSQSYAGLLKEGVCKTIPEECSLMASFSNRQELGKNFLLLNIYYETLNFESIVEEPLIDPFTFLSSIGGALGLWIGLSMLSVCEILQLAAEMVMCIVTKLRNPIKTS